jgi:hypothetical protein
LRLTIGQSVSKSCCRAPSEAHEQIFISLTVTVLFLWGALSDERTGLSFVYAADPCQRSLSLLRVPRDSRPCFAVSDFRLSLSSSPTTRSVTVKVFDPASTPAAFTSKLNCSEQSRALAYCRQPATTVTLDIEPPWDPWSYICSVSRLFFFRCFSFDKKGGVGLVMARTA